MLFVLLLGVGFSSLVHAQEAACNCTSDLEFLNRKVRKIPAFKQNKENYQKAYTQAIGQASAQMDPYDCFQLINEVLLSLNDWHMGVFEPSSEQANQSKVRFPSYSGDLNELLQRLEKKPGRPN